MQPAWRNGDAMVKVAPADADWEPILRGGPNGLAVVVTALSWWVLAIEPDDQNPLELLEAIGDVSWVLSELLGVLLSTKKHSLEEASAKEPESKRYVLTLINIISIINKLAESNLATKMPFSQI